MQLIDSHCHLDDTRFEPDRSDVIRRAKAAGIHRFIVPAIHADSCIRLQKLSRQYAEISPAYGLHPWFCDRHQPEDIPMLEQLTGSAVAIGECGLDFGCCDTDAEAQLFWLRTQLKLAEEARLPVILHSVKATDMLIAELRHYPGLRGVVHSFAGSLQQAEQLIDMGFHLGFGGAVMRPNARKVHAVVRGIPLQSLLIETDAPDQSPTSHRGERNEPAFLIEILNAIASLRGMECEALAAASLKNTEELFDL